jgi:hypothetical protein
MARCELRGNLADTPSAFTRRIRVEISESAFADSSVSNARGEKQQKDISAHC